MNASCAVSYSMAEPSSLTGAAEKPDSLVSSSKERSEVSDSKISACSSPYFAYSKPNNALRPGSSSLRSCALKLPLSIPPTVQQGYDKRVHR